MRLVVGKAPLMRILKWTQRALFASAFLLLGYCGFALVDAWIFQASGLLRIRSSGRLDFPGARERESRPPTARSARGERGPASTAVLHFSEERARCRDGRDGRSDRPH